MTGTPAVGVSNDTVAVGNGELGAGSEALCELIAELEVCRKLEVEVDVCCVLEVERCSWQLMLVVIVM